MQLPCNRLIPTQLLWPPDPLGTLHCAFSWSHCRHWGSHVSQPMPSPLLNDRSGKPELVQQVVKQVCKQRDWISFDQSPFCFVVETQEREQSTDREQLQPCTHMMKHAPPEAYNCCQVSQCKGQLPASFTRSGDALASSNRPGRCIQKRKKKYQNIFLWPFIPIIPIIYPIYTHYMIYIYIYPI